MGARRCAVCLLLFSAAGSGCASKPPRPAIEFVQPPSDRAYVYIFLRDSLDRHRFELWLDGESVGLIGPGNFAFYQLRPGRHVLNAGFEEDAEFPLHVLGGEVVYLQLLVTTAPVGGGSTGSEFQRVSRKEGRAGVRGCTIILDRPPPLPPPSESGPDPADSAADDS